jgi:hypothetical protein
VIAAIFTALFGSGLAGTCRETALRTGLRAELRLAFAFVGRFFTELLFMVQTIASNVNAEQKI